ncbi:probable tubulin polyglutamylase TTLL2 [Scomber japonicus]|uniref:probable tubulin polyglutamylase TTLL2 n=1 Tax=Scomber japonicus TaxID=13676 RepID=UPI002305842D|nr:probable tubulin polyglutamylase TTLL2 [Scomber japonicus]
MAASSLVFRLHERGPELVREVLLERGWEEYDEGQREEEDWNLYWRGSAFRSAEYHKLLPWQRLNHHPKTVGITRKDCLARNLRRMRATFSSSLYDFSPTAFILPNDFTRFLSEYDHLRLTQTLPVYWICKPVRLSRGRGIFIFENIKDLIYDCSVIVQRYVSDPLLISGYKFDLRIYVCVKSFHPLTVYIHQEGLVRFSTEKYNLSSLQNLYAHLTNTSINKFGPFYKTEKQRVGQGCKWTMSKFRHFLHSLGTDELLLWQRINNIVTLTLLTIAPSVPSCPNCVELFGFDILIDVRLKPWLLEVNYSPALTLDCQADIAVKKGLIGDLIDLMSYKSIDGLRESAYRRRGNLNLILGSRWRTDRQTCPGLASSLQVSEPMNHDDTQTETETQLSAETDVSSQIPDIPPQALRFKSPAASCKLPNIHRVGRIRPVRIHQEAETSSNRRHVPPLRVGGFIRTFPFNAATLKASRHTLDVKTVIQEIHKLTNQLAAGRSVRKRPKSDEEEEKKNSDGGEEEEFESLFWGPNNPPLLSQTLKQL